jgi:hypothetical protein
MPPQNSKENYGHYGNGGCYLTPQHMVYGLPYEPSISASHENLMISNAKMGNNLQYHKNVQNILVYY